MRYRHIRAGLASELAFILVALTARPALAQWSTDSLSTARYNHAAVNSGGWLYLGGGWTGASTTDSVEVYDPTSSTWSSTSLSSARHRLAAAAEGDVVAFAGGITQISSGATDTVDLYDISNQAWSSTQLPHRMYWFSGVGVNGKLVFHGGNDDSGPVDFAQIYDIATDTWSTKALSPGQRAGNATVTDGIRAFLVGGGCHCKPGSETVDIYDTTTGVWSQTRMPRNRTRVSATISNGRLYVAGDCTDLSAIDVYDIATERWSTIYTPTKNRCATRVEKVGPFLVFAGGVGVYGFDLSYRPPADVLHVESGSWWTTPISAHGEFSAIASSEEHSTLLIAGGRFDAFDDVTDNVDIFRFEHSVGTNYCGPSNLNSTGQAALLSGSGLPLAEASLLTLTATQVPTHQLGVLLTSQTQDFFSPPGSQGNLCLGGNLARYSAQARSSGGAGVLEWTPDLSHVPTNPPTSIGSGETWSFQVWFRDQNPGHTSNFTEGLVVTFQ